MPTTPKRIDLSLFDDNLKILINAAAKIFPVEYTYVSTGTNPNNYEYVKILTGEHKREIYLWVDNSWGLIGADDADIDFSSLKNIPTSYPPSTHTHIETDITNLDKYSKAESNILLAGKSNTDHTHALLHNHPNIDILAALTQTNLDLWNTVSGKAPALHDHDGRYFTEAEITVALNDKSNTSHNHDMVYAAKAIEATVEDVDTRLYNIEMGYSEGHRHGNLDVLDKLSYTGANAIIDLKAIEDNTTAISGKAAVGHIHDERYYTETEMDTKLSGKSDTGHIHDERYYTETEVDSKLSSKADKTYVDTELAKKAEATTVSGHISNTAVHVTQVDKDVWYAKEPGISIGAVQPTENNMWYKTI